MMGSSHICSTGKNIVVQGRSYTVGTNNGQFWLCCEVTSKVPDNNDYYPKVLVPVFGPVTKNTKMFYNPENDVYIAALQEFIEVHAVQS